MAILCCEVDGQHFSHNLGHNDVTGHGHGHMLLNQQLTNSLGNDSVAS